ncbi:MAG: carbamoyl-phosphate synthase large subunit [Rhodospirillales bacterium]|nr:carbamoyl-phosphate synthase large subunit [Alphaproteobacteria bacterium]MBL6947199.1 carbamoyl-phosphate synthase large subunit [Rhodospirillales bacterium]
MPKRTDISTIMIIGAGPIVIGQACEFDYSGAQACKALREEGYRVVLVNSNPATIMTDPSMADATYVEPITLDMLERVIVKERPDALLPTMGGQTGLNAGIELAEAGILDKYGVELIGAKADVIDKAEDREKFRDAMANIGLECPVSRIVHTMEEGRTAMKEIGLPMIIRPSFTLGGIGGGIANTLEEYEKFVASGLDASPVTQVLVEESILGWKEFEMEVVRDKADNCIIICSIENVDPMGVHTGDSITVAPALTLTDKEYQIMRNASIDVLREIGVETGGSNVQFAVDPDTGRLLVIEMNPRVSRSSALASKATGFPIAKIAAKLAVGYTLDELDNDITGVTPASFEPTIDYVVTKIPRFTFEKFPGTDALLSSSMKSVGEAMSIGGTFAESLQKGLRSMETGLTGLNEIEGFSEGGDDILEQLGRARPDRLLLIAQAFRLGHDLETIRDASKYDPWFLEQIEVIVAAEDHVRQNGLPGDVPGLLALKAMGFSDERLGELTGEGAAAVTKLRRTLDIGPAFKRVDTCAAEFPSQTSYMYSSYSGNGLEPPECEAEPSDRKKAIILGGGPNRIGQGIEFDYCCVHAAYALKDAGIEAIMVNCNPETVSTDYDTSDRLYFEPLTAEDVIELIRVEQRSGELMGVIVQLGGQTPLKLSHALEAEGIPVLGTSPDAIDLAEDRERFQALLQDLDLKQPKNGLARSDAEAEAVAQDVGFPLVIRPSYVLGGRAMEIVHDMDGLRRYMTEAVHVSGTSPVLLDSFLEDAIEIDVDALADGEDIYVAGIMQHIEEAGIHSGDSACSLPPYSLDKDTIAELERQTALLAGALGVVGLMNVQYAVKDGDIYLIEVNPRASRTVPFVAKATGIPVAKLAARVMVGEKLKSFGLPVSVSALETGRGHFAVKEAVFPFARFPGVDIILGPEMKSTGEVMGLDTDFERAFAKAQLGAGNRLPDTGTAFISVKERDKNAAARLAKRLAAMGFGLLATGGTQEFLSSQGLEVTRINKVLQGAPHCVDAINDGGVQLVINTTEGVQAIADSYTIRRGALVNNIPHFTTMTGAAAAVGAMEAIAKGSLEVMPLQAYFDTSY